MAQYPLDGLRIVEFGEGAAAPICTMILANMGAEVIKVESLKYLDSMRLSPDNKERDPNKDPWFHCVNRNKLGITIDITNPKAQQLLKQLIKISDVVVENFSPGTMDRRGLGYQSLVEVKPDIIMLSMPTAGNSGPLRDIVAYGPDINGLAGIDSLVGYYQEEVLGTQQAYSDHNSGIHGAFAVLVALYYRKRTGKGQYIEMAQWELLTSCIGEAIMEYTMNGRVLGTQGNRHPTMAPHNNYRCKGEDKWVSVAIKTEDEWRSFCEAIGNPPWTKDDRFADRLSRLRNQEALDKFISQWTINYTHYEVMEILQKAGVAAMPCLDSGERYFDPHFRGRQVYIDYESPTIGVDIIVGMPWKMSDTPGGIQRPAPNVGEHNDYVFGKLLGLPKEEINKLTEEKVLY